MSVPFLFAAGNSGESFDLGASWCPHLPRCTTRRSVDCFAGVAVDPPLVGHYCFVALIGTKEFPAPSFSKFIDMDAFGTFIRFSDRWHGATSISCQLVLLPEGVAGFTRLLSFRYFLPGVPCENRPMTIEVVATLSPGATFFMDLEPSLLSAFELDGQLQVTHENQRPAPKEHQ